MGVLGATVSFLHAVIGSTIMLLYPVYASTRAMESASSRHHQQWLTYWVLLSFLTLFELHCSSIVSWIPVWPYVKVLFCMWLVLPSFNGAAYLYENIVIKYINIESKDKERFKDHIKEVADKEEEKEKEEEEEEEEEQEKEEDDEEKKIFKAWKLVEDYIDKAGPDSLERIVKTGLEAERAEMKKLKET